MDKGLKVGVLAAVVVSLGLAGCGDDNQSSDSAERYCELVDELEAIGGEVFADLDEDATDEDLAAAEADFADQADDELNELEDVAPEEIADDVEDFVAAIRDRAQGGEGPDVSAAEERILEFENENC